MRPTPFVLAPLLLAGCSSFSQPPTASNGGASPAGCACGVELAAETRARTAGDVDTLAQGERFATQAVADNATALRAYCDARVQAETQDRVSGDGSGWTLAKTYVDVQLAAALAALPKITEPHIVNAQTFTDYGRLAFGEFTAEQENGADVQVAHGAWLHFYFVGANCTGQAFLIDPPSSISSARYVAPWTLDMNGRGSLFKSAGAMAVLAAASRYKVDLSAKPAVVVCEGSVVGAIGLPVTASGGMAFLVRPELLSVTMKPAK